MARVLVTGSTDGIGRESARHLLDAGHVVVAHARDFRAGRVREVLPGRHDVVVGEDGLLARPAELAGTALER